MPTRKPDAPRVWTPTIARLEALDPRGVAFHVAGPTENFRVREYGGEVPFTRAILEELGPDDMLLDVGACIGLVSVHAAMRCRSVVAVEPDPQQAQRIRQNAELNHLTNLAVVEALFGEAVGRCDLQTDGIEGPSPSMKGQGRGATVSVVCTTIDTEIAAGRVPPPDVLKIDVEGAELLVLKGARQLLASGRRPRAIFLELHPAFLPAFGAGVQDVLDLLHAAGYQGTCADRWDQQLGLFRDVRAEAKRAA